MIIILISHQLFSRGHRRDRSNRSGASRPTPTPGILLAILYFAMATLPVAQYIARRSAARKSKMHLHRRPLHDMPGGRRAHRRMPLPRRHRRIGLLLTTHDSEQAAASADRLPFWRTTPSVSHPPSMATIAPCRRCRPIPSTGVRRHFASWLFPVAYRGAVLAAYLFFI